MIQCERFFRPNVLTAFERRPGRSERIHADFEQHSTIRLVAGEVLEQVRLGRTYYYYSLVLCLFYGRRYAPPSKFTVQGAK